MIRLEEESSETEETSKASTGHGDLVGTGSWDDGGGGGGLDGGADGSSRGGGGWGSGNSGGGAVNVDRGSRGRGWDSAVTN
jgi:hypothetical protein